MPKPTWSNHHNIWRDAGVEFVEYKYYKPETCGLNFEAMMDDLKVHNFALFEFKILTSLDGT